MKTYKVPDSKESRAYDRARAGAGVSVRKSASEKAFFRLREEGLKAAKRKAVRRAFAVAVAAAHPPASQETSLLAETLVMVKNAMMTLMRPATSREARLAELREDGMALGLGLLRVFAPVAVVLIVLAWMLR